MKCVRLAWHELQLAATQGVMRQLEAVASGRPDQHGFEGAGWQVHIEGALGELAVAKALDRYWSGSVNTFKAGGDVGQLQVRTRSQHHYDLLVRPDDPDDAYFVLVTGTAPEYRVHGYLLGRDCKEPRWLRTYAGRPPAYFVPQAALIPID